MNNRARSVYRASPYRALGIHPCGHVLYPSKSIKLISIGNSSTREEIFPVLELLTYLSRSFLLHWYPRDTWEVRSPFISETWVSVFVFSEPVRYHCLPIMFIHDGTFLTCLVHSRHFLFQPPLENRQLLFVHRLSLATMGRGIFPTARYNFRR